MRALVTGGTGFVGSNLVRTLVKQGWDVIATGHDAEQTLADLPVTILQPSFLELDWKRIGPIDVLFHQAAINNTLFLDRGEMLRANVESSKALFRQVMQSGCRRIVFASSTAIYGNGPVPYTEAQPAAPLNPYAESKVLLEEHAMELAKTENDLRIVGLRYCNVYGPGESHKGRRASMIWQLARQMTRGNPRLFEHGEQKRDYIYVEDVVAANLRAATAAENVIVNCGSGTATSFNDLVTILNETLHLSRRAEYFPNPHPAAYQSHTLCDMTRARTALGFSPAYSIRDGIAAYAASGSLVG